MKEYVNPPTLNRSPVYSQAVVVREPTATIYVGGQNATNPDGEVVADDLRSQTVQALTNVEAALQAAGASIHDIVRWTVAIVDGQPVLEGAEAFRTVWGDAPNPPAVTLHVVAGLADPSFLVEIDAVAAL